MRFVLAFLFGLLPGLAAAQTVEPYFFGMQFVTPVSSQPQAKVFASLTRLWGATYGGAGVNWAAIETCKIATVSQTDPCLTWTAADAIVANAQAAGMDIEYTFGITPSWASVAGTQDQPPTSFQDFYNFVTLVTTRYKGKTKYYSIWNEANYGGTSQAYWSGTVAQMVTIASNVYPLIKAIDPNATVLSPSIACGPGSLTSPGGFGWMQQFLAGGGGAYADGIDFHPYLYMSASGTEGSPLVSYPEQVAQMVKWLQAAMAAYSISLPIVASEGGWATTTSTPSASVQTAYAALWNWLLAGSGVSRSIWYIYDDVSTGWGPLWNQGAGWLDAQGVAFRTAQSWLMGATITSAPARVANSNQVRNPTGSGVAAGTPGTPPTNWGVYNPDITHGITTAIVGSGTEGGIAYVDWSVSGTETSGGTGYVQIGFEAANQIAASVGQTWVEGAYFKVISRSGNCQTWLAANENNSSGGSGYLASPLYLPFEIPTGGALSAGYTEWKFKTAQATVAYVAPYFVVSYAVGSACSITVRIGQPSVDSGTVWSGNATLAGGYPAQIIWDSAGGPTARSTTYAYLDDVTGGQTAIVGDAITLTNLPVLLTNRAQKGWMP